MMKEFAPYIVPLLIAALIIRRSGKARHVKPGRMWIRPALFVFMAATALAAGPMPDLLAITAFVAAAGVGGGLGYLMARHQHLSIDPETGKVSSRATTIGTALILGLFAIRFGARLVFPELGEPGHGGHQMTQAANGLLIFTVAVLIAQSTEVWRRTRPLIAAHAARTAGPGSPAEAPPATVDPKAQPTAQSTE